MQDPHAGASPPPSNVDPSNVGPMYRSIESKVREALAPELLEITDESYMHAVPQGAESHFRLLVVADAFEGRSLVQRHQAVYRALAEEMSGQIHALAMQTLTPAEWNENERPRATSPECLGGGKAEA